MPKRFGPSDIAKVMQGPETALFRRLTFAGVSKSHNLSPYLRDRFFR